MRTLAPDFLRLAPASGASFVNVAQLQMQAIQMAALHKAIQKPSVKQRQLHKTIAKPLPLRARNTEQTAFQPVECLPYASSFVATAKPTVAAASPEQHVHVAESQQMEQEHSTEALATVRVRLSGSQWQPPTFTQEEHQAVDNILIAVANMRGIP